MTLKEEGGRVPSMEDGNGVGCGFVWVVGSGVGAGSQFGDWVGRGSVVGWVG